MTEKKTKILLAEDERIIQYTLAEGLRAAGYEVICADDGEAAWAIFQQDTCDIALLDIRMPGLDGIALAKRILAIADIPLIFLTAYDDSDLLESAKKLGAATYLVKPLKVGQIIPAIEMALAQGTSMQRLREKNLHLETALQSSRNIAVAIGVLRERLGVSEDKAFEYLRAKARNQRRKVNEVAQEIVTNCN
ncbi:response regulator receiver and ANTAR domain protein [Formivibrio citricus]|uniref:Response regulator receiver and ANTAR domain protein n=1 Tax=Formivibrio citricus TaxID=83765 RepID=A0A1I5A544_9NEIS|nr:response regulator [Formivibrio citricus]SFN57573.1 response regulator receiver and ANTAR domain protein [Formivibrio citricus]